MKDFKQIEQNEIFYRVVDDFFVKEIIFIAYNEMLKGEGVLFGWFYKLDDIENENVTAFCLTQEQFNNECFEIFSDALCYVYDRMEELKGNLKILIENEK